MRTNTISKQRFLLRALFFSLIVFVFLLSVFIQPAEVSAATIQADPQVVEHFGEDFAYNYAHANQIINQLQGAWNSSAMREMGLLTRAEQSQFQSQHFYPDYIGGVYFDNNGRLVILVVEDMAGQAESLQARSRSLDNDAVIVRNVRFSFNELDEAHRYIFDVLDNCPDRENLSNFNRTGGGVDIINNVLDIRLLDLGCEELNLENVRLFRETIFDSPFLRFHIVDPALIPVLRGLYCPTDDIEYQGNFQENSLERNSNTTLFGGDRIFPNGGSIGFRAFCNRTGQAGFVTSRHVVGDTANTIVRRGTSNGTEIGRLVRTHPVTDSAFVRVTNGFTIGEIRFGDPINLVRNTPSNTPVHGSASPNLVGQTYFMMGATTNRPVSGQVTHVNESVPTRILGSNVTLQGITLVTYNAQAGDSGGIIYRNGGFNFMFTNGIHMGATTYVTPGQQRSMVMPVQNILTALDLRLW